MEETRATDCPIRV